MNLTAKYYVCQHCGLPIRNWDRVEKCAYSSEQICSRCSVDDKFSTSVANQIPPEYHEKFRFYTEITWFVLASLLIAFVSSTWMEFKGWDSSNVFGILIGLIIVIVKWIIAFVIFKVILKLPRLGTWLFYWWIEKPKNRQRIEEDVKRYQAGNYETQDVWYYRKLRLYYTLKKLKLKPLYLIVIVGNLAMIYLFSTLRSQNNYGGSEFSAAAGVLFVIVQFANIFTVWAGGAFYCKKQIDNRKLRLTVELLSWGYMFFFTFAFIMFAWGYFVRYGIFSAIPLSVGMKSIEFFAKLYIFSAGLMVGLGIILWLATPDFRWRNNNQDAREAPNGLHRGLRKIVILSLYFAFALILVLSSELVMVDVLMVISLLSYYLIIVYGFVIFALLKLLPKSPKFSGFPKRLHYSTLIKLSAVIFVVNFLPTAGTLLYTNPSLESQFNAVFGPTWKTDMQDDPTYPYMHQVSFSMYDAYFGYNVPVNAKYGQVYMQSHPRFVKDNVTNAILSDGSAVFNNLTHDLKFDAYLPARPEFTNITFGDDRPKTFPVLIFLHGSGSGVDRGAWNANFTTQYFANLGYVAFDVSFGLVEYANYPNTEEKPFGYDYVDSILQIANFTKYLEAHADYYHADLSNTYVIGRSLGGWMALSVGYLANSTYAGGNFSSQIQIRGVVPFYPASDFPGFGSKFFNLLGDLFDYFDWSMLASQIRGSSEPTDPNFNPDWLWYNPLWVAENVESGCLPLTFGLQGTHDSNIPAMATHRLEDILKKNGHKVITGYYPFCGHTFDVVHWSPYGQSILYYMERMMALTSVN